MTDANTAALPIRPDGEWHTVSVTLAANPNWKDKADKIWFDPMNLDAAYVDIKWLRFKEQ